MLNNFSVVFLFLIILIFSTGNSNPILNGEDIGEVKFDRMSKAMIVTGQNIYPYMVRVDINGVLRAVPGKVTSIGCGGVLISEGAILTAAHCLEEFSELELVQIQAGIVHLIFEQNAGQIRYMKYYVKHDGYSGECDVFNGLIVHCLSDIAVIFVNKPFIFGPNVKKARLSRAIDGLGHNKEGLILGWGNRMNRMLQKARMKIIERNECQLRYNNVFIGDDMICLLSANRNQGSCSGDSGGPFILNGIVYGISSFGFSHNWGDVQACNSGKPSIYTNVEDYYIWIQEQLKTHQRKFHLKKL